MSFWIAMSMIALILAYCGLDVWLSRSNRETISAAMRRWGHQYPIIPFLLGLLVGVLAGHWWGAF
jgi:hypothetical protein